MQDIYTTGKSVLAEDCCTDLDRTPSMCSHPQNGCREREPERTLYISAKAILAKMEFDIKAKNQHEIAFTTVILVVVCVNIFNYI